MTDLSLERTEACDHGFYPEPGRRPAATQSSKEFEHTEDYAYYRFVCKEGDWTGPWWSDWGAAGRDGVHHYGIAHPSLNTNSPPANETPEDGDDD